MDDELSELVRQELDRHTKSLADQPTVANARAIAHSMKGALGLVGAREPSEAFGRIERRLVAGDPRAQADLGELLGRLRSLLAEGRPLPASTWPLPPADLRAGLDESPHRAEYLAAVRDRLAKIDAALSTSRDEEAARAVFREVHTIKGAALAVGDDVMAWFCHGLEERLRSVADPPAARRALEEVDTYRGGARRDRRRAGARPGDAALDVRHAEALTPTAAHAAPAPAAAPGGRGPQRLRVPRARRRRDGPRLDRRARGPARARRAARSAARAALERRRPPPARRRRRARDRARHPRGAAHDRPPPPVGRPRGGPCRPSSGAPPSSRRCPSAWTRPRRR
jgi:chemotaxis protein histidine kinase CheA